MKKKYYVRPSMMIEQGKAALLVCASQDITSDVGIDYGGVDEEGIIVAESRRNSVWDDDEDDWN